MSDTDTTTATEWLTRYGVTFDWTADGFHADPDGWEHQRFTLTLSHRRNRDRDPVATGSRDRHRPDPREHSPRDRFGRPLRGDGLDRICR